MAEQALHCEARFGAAALAHLDALAQLRMTVFAEWPYLYDGDLDYERDYLRAYFDAPDSLVIVAFDGGKAVGATTAVPLAHAETAMQRPFLECDMAVDEYLYFGESVVLRPWRGMGLGGRFFVEREAHARRLGLRRTAFCAVDRPPDHALRPPRYRGNDAFWRKRGYVHHPELSCRLQWKDIDAAVPSWKSLSFWLKDLTAST